MKKLTSIILILFLSLLSSPSWSETLTMDDLVERNDLYYKKFTDVPFTGEVINIDNLYQFEIIDAHTIPFHLAFVSSKHNPQASYP